MPDILNAEVDIRTGRACSECRSASMSCIVLVFVVLIFSLPTLVAVCSRMVSDSDGHLEKMTCVIGSSVGFVCSLSSVLIYSLQCGDHLSKKSEVMVDHHEVLVEYSWTFGIGSICLIVSAAFNFISAVGHLCVISPELPPEMEQLLPDTADMEKGETEQPSAQEQEKKDKAHKKEELERSLAAARAAAAEADRVKEEAAQLAKEALAEADGDKSEHGIETDQSDLMYPQTWQSLAKNDDLPIGSDDVAAAQVVAEKAGEAAAEGILPASHPGN